MDVDGNALYPAEVRLRGEATVWDDYMIPGTAVKATGNT